MTAEPGSLQSTGLQLDTTKGTSTDPKLRNRHCPFIQSLHTVDTETLVFTEHVQNLTDTNEEDYPGPEKPTFCTGS